MPPLELNLDLDEAVLEAIAQGHQAIEDPYPVYQGQDDDHEHDDEGGRHGNSSGNPF
jgi:hypothetical protein